MRIRYVNARNPGASHDALIWYTSDARRYFVQKFEAGDRGSWLLGDAGFALEPFLITPYKGALPATYKSDFNKRHSAARNIVERSIGNLKSRFRCLLNTLYYEPKKAVNIFNVCCALHNICKEYNVEINDQTNQEMDHDLDNEIYGDYLEEAARIRDQLAQMNFN